MDYLAGEDISIVVPFVVDGEFVVPDANSVSYTLRGNDGAAISGQVEIDLTPTASATEVKVLIDAEYNAKTLDIENRFLIVAFQVSGQTYQARVNYRLIDFLTFTCTADNVRALLGVNRREWSDEQIDLVASYYYLASLFEDGAFDEHLQAGSLLSVYANQAIAANAALLALPGLQLSVAGEEGTDSTSYRRLQTIDFEAVRNSIKAVLDNALGSLGAGEFVELSLFASGARTDPFTGT